MTKLDEICAKKREHVREMRARYSLQLLEQRALRAEVPRGFLNALEQKQTQREIGLIAEVKKASPSKGLIREDFDPVNIAQAYERGGATCLSVLTDEPYFQGHDDYLREVKRASGLPVLRKDFMLEEYQIIESRALGADCILLIMAALDIHQVKALEACAHDLGMDVLIEVHDRAELELALTHLKSPLIGINNRNLKTFETSLSITESLAMLIPENYVIVCESGIFHYQHIERMLQQQIHCFLVGESLMRQKNVQKATAQLLQNH